LFLAVPLHFFQAFRRILPYSVEIYLVGKFRVNIFHAPQLGATDRSPGGKKEIEHWFIRARQLSRIDRPTVNKAEVEFR
jgi:hypothetical protein